MAARSHPEAIFARLVAQWEGWKHLDPTANESIVADDFRSFWPDGSEHVGRPTRQQMAEQPITGYLLSQFRVVPIGSDAALITYFADITTPGDIEHHLAVGEVWKYCDGEWRIHGFSGTLC